MRESLSRRCSRRATSEVIRESGLEAGDIDARHAAVLRERTCARHRARCSSRTLQCGVSAPPLSLENANDQRNGFFTTKSDVAEHQGAVNGFVPQ
jgi:hypothetical protein